MVSKGFVGCTLGCLAGGGIEPNAAMLCLFSCYLVETREGNEDGGPDPGNGSDDGNGDAIDDGDGDTDDLGDIDDDGDGDTGNENDPGTSAPSR
jgi:hypothetical protein